MKIAVYTNGGGGCEGSHVSIFIYVIEGKYDDELNWPFVGNVDIELLNQLEDRDHHSMEVRLIINAGGNGIGYPKYNPHSKLTLDSASNTQYLKDDTLYFRISVEVSDHKPWLECTV